GRHADRERGHVPLQRRGPSPNLDRKLRSKRKLHAGGWKRMVMMRAVPVAAVKPGLRSVPPRTPGRAGGRPAGRAQRARQVEHVPEWRTPAPLWDQALLD